MADQFDPFGIRGMSDEQLMTLLNRFGQGPYGQTAGTLDVLRNNPSLLYNLRTSNQPQSQQPNQQPQTIFQALMAQQMQAAQAQGAQGAGAGGAGGTYYGWGGNAAGYGTPGFGAGGGTGAGIGGGTNMAATTTATQIPIGISLPSWQTWYGQNLGKTVLVNGQVRTIGQDLGPDDALAAYRQGQYSFGNLPGAQAPASAAQIGATTQPESVALQQMQQIDPVSEALRGGLGTSYLSQLAQTSAPTAGQFQSYLDLYRQVDPTGAAARQQLGQDLAAQEALGTQLDPATQREVEQATREAQIARGNVYGTPQLVQEAMTRGTAGLALQQQRQQALQGYLSSGQTMGDVAMNLYNQQQSQLRAAQGAALGYLGSGQTPYQAGATYLNTAEQRAAMAAQGGPQYNPQALGGQYTGAGAPSFPQYGLDMSQLAGNWYNNINQANLQAYGLQQAYGGGGAGGKGGKAAAGAIGGAASGALAGAAAGGVGAIPGALIGAIGGGLGGYFG